MDIKSNQNYVILSNSIDEKLLERFNEYKIINEDSFQELQEKLENYIDRVVVFNDTLRRYTDSEKKQILSLLKLRNINFILITSNIEEATLGEYIFVFDHDNIVLEGKNEDVLKEEKILKRLGLGLPFAVDVSIQLKYYGILDKIYYDVESLVSSLWN